MATFKAPAAGTIRRAAPTNPISAIFKSIVGLFVGILIVLFLVPVVLWFAESQNSAKVFSHSKSVDALSGASGYIRTMGVVNANSPVPCYENKVEGNCLYYNYVLEELQYEVRDYCGNLGANQKVIETKGQQCRRNSNDEEVCEQCYVVNESKWNSVKSEKKFLPFSVGNFKVSSPGDAKLVEVFNYNKQVDSTHRESMDYIKDKTELLVSGSSDGTYISDGGSKKYLLISTKDYQSTLKYLKSRDKAASWFLRILSLFLLFVGYMMIFGPISVMSNFVRKIPFVGKWVDNAVDSMIFLISLGLAIVHFIVLWILIIILKNIIVIGIVIGLFLLFYLYIYPKFIKKDKAKK